MIGPLGGQNMNEDPYMDSQAPSSQPDLAADLHQSFSNVPISHLSLSIDLNSPSWMFPPLVWVPSYNRGSNTLFGSSISISDLGQRSVSASGHNPSSSGRQTTSPIQSRTSQTPLDLSGDKENRVDPNLPQNVRGQMLQIFPKRKLQQNQGWGIRTGNSWHLLRPRKLSGKWSQMGLPLKKMGSKNSKWKEVAKFVLEEGVTNLVRGDHISCKKRWKTLSTD